jgi:hypothetical protein
MSLCETVGGAGGGSTCVATFCDPKQNLPRKRSATVCALWRRAWRWAVILVGLVLGGLEGDVTMGVTRSLGAGPDGLGGGISAGWGGSVGICGAEID